MSKYRLAVLLPEQQEREQARRRCKCKQLRAHCYVSEDVSKRAHGYRVYCVHIRVNGLCAQQ